MRSLVAAMAAAVIVGSGLTAGITTTAAAVPDQAPSSRTSLTWHECRELSDVPDAKCATLTVPLDWDAVDDTRTASIEIAVQRATGTRAERLGALTFNPGGPGVSGLDAFGRILGRNPLFPWAGLPQSVQRRFDIVAWDPRGIGQSQPQLRGCSGMPNFGDLPATGPVDWTAATRAYMESLAPILQDCITRNPEVAPYMGTHYVVRDLEALRAALSEPQWNFWGMSYGTQVGSAYARMYPQRLRTLVLDGAVPANATLLERGAHQVWSRQYAVSTFASSYGPKFATKVRRVIKAMDRRTIESEVLGAQTRWDIMRVAIGQLNAEFNYKISRTIFIQLYEALFAPEAAARDRAASKLALLSDELRIPDELRISEELRALGDPDRSPAYMTWIVNCADIHDRPTVDQVANLARSAEEAGLTIAGTWTIERGAWCPGVRSDFGRALPRMGNPLKLPHSAIVVNSTGDPFTAWIGARQMADSILGARMISFTSSQHVTYRQVPAPCVDDPVTHYFLTAGLPSVDLACAFVPGKGIVLGAG